MLMMYAALAMLQGDPALESKVESALAKLTLEEKIDLLGGVDGFYVRELPKAGLPRLKMADGPVGVRNDGKTTAYPSGFTLAATWNPSLVRQFGEGIGQDARARGVHIWLGPGINLARIVQNGRNFEYLGEDPYLAGTLATEIVKGVQSQGVVATVKHFAGNEHESDRNNDDSIIDERTLRELHLRAFEMVVRNSAVGAVMSSYNLVNGVHASENRHLLRDILKDEWGFKGLVMSDWVSVYSAQGPYKNGLDLEMPSGEWMNRKNLLGPIQNGTLDVKDLDDKVRRILRVAYAFNFDLRPQKDASIALDNPDNVRRARAVVAEGTVLLKNQNAVLPLSNPNQRILVVGPNAGRAVTGGGGSSYTQPFRSVSLRDALEKQKPVGTVIDYASSYVDQAQAAANTTFDGPVKAEYFAGIELKGAPIFVRDESKIDNNWRDGRVNDQVKGEFSVRWTAKYTPKESGEHLFVARTDDGMRVFVDGKKVLDEWHDQGETTYTVPVRFTAGKTLDIRVEYYQRAGDAIARFGITSAIERALEANLPASKLAAADTVVVGVGFDSSKEGEGFDRPWALPNEQVALLKYLGKHHKRVIVVLNAGAGVEATSWINGVSGLLHAGYPGGEGNEAIADILYGRISPSGKLPTSYPGSIKGTYYENAYPAKDHKLPYNEGLFIGYRWFDANRKAPLFPFGYGLSYSKFKLSKGQAKLVNGDVVVTATLQNVGSVKAAETVQVYAHPPKSKVVRPVQELRTFAKVELAPGESQTVTMTFPSRDLAWYDVRRKGWVIDEGEYRLNVGTSSRNQPLKVKLLIR